MQYTTITIPTVFLAGSTDLALYTLKGARVLDVIQFELVDGQWRLRYPPLDLKNDTPDELSDVA